MNFPHFVQNYRDWPKCHGDWPGQPSSILSCENTSLAGAMTYGTEGWACCLAQPRPSPQGGRVGVREEEAHSPSQMEDVPVLSTQDSSTQQLWDLRAQFLLIGEFWFAISLIGSSTKIPIASHPQNFLTCLPLASHLLLHSPCPSHFPIFSLSAKCIYARWRSYLFIYKTRKRLCMKYKCDTIFILYFKSFV